MEIKRFVKQIPFAARAHRTFNALAREHTNRGILRQLEHTPYSQGAKIAEALKSFRRGLPQSDRGWIEKIELERKRLLNRKEPVVDGSLGPAWYDNGATVEQACLDSKGPKPALLLFLLTRALRPNHVIELGTNVGISSAYIGAALKLNGRNGQLITLDVCAYRQRLAKEIHSNLGLDNIGYVRGLFTETLSPSLVQLGSVVLAFIDGDHKYQPTLDYFEEILRFATLDAVFVFDDIRWSDGMRRAWSRIRSDERLGVIVDLDSVGVCIRRQDGLPRLVCGPISGLIN
jgi:predicted O-methyltransferase YrrM